jgi:hypothetical protein
MALLALATWVAPAAAVGPLDVPDYTDCLERDSSTVEPTQTLVDGTLGNAWARNDRFFYPEESFCTDTSEGEIVLHGVSVLVKTPYQVDLGPTDDNDIDSVAEAEEYEDQMAIDFPSFLHHGFNARGGDGVPAHGPEDFFTAVSGCLDLSIADCLADPPVPLQTAAGQDPSEPMIFTILFEEPELLFPGDSFTVVSITRSNVTEGVLAPERLIAWDFRPYMVPEPALALLVLPALGWALRAGRRTH